VARMAVMARSDSPQRMSEAAPPLSSSAKAKKRESSVGSAEEMAQCEYLPAAEANSCWTASMRDRRQGLTLLVTPLQLILISLETLLALPLPVSHLQLV
jgi:hypothetical protein